MVSRPSRAFMSTYVCQVHSPNFTYAGGRCHADLQTGIATVSIAVAILLELLAAAEH